MQFFTVAALFVAGVMASPLEVRTGGDRPVCNPGLYSNPQCCATDVLGVADLNCYTPEEVPRDARNFKEICAKGGQRARCCVVPILGQDLLCQTPVGISG